MKKSIVLTGVFISFFIASHAQEAKTIIAPAYDNINKEQLWEQQAKPQSCEQYALLEKKENKFLIADKPMLTLYDQADFIKLNGHSIGIYTGQTNIHNVTPKALPVSYQQ